MSCIAGGASWPRDRVLRGGAAVQYGVLRQGEGNQRFRRLPIQHTNICAHGTWSVYLYTVHCTAYQYLCAQHLVSIPVHCTLYSIPISGQFKIIPLIFYLLQLHILYTVCRVESFRYLLISHSSSYAVVNLFQTLFEIKFISSD